MSRTQAVARNIMSLLLTQAVTWVLTTCVMLYLPSYIGDAGLGQLTLSGSFTAMALLAVNLGTGTVTVRDVARYPERARDYLAAATLQRLVIGLVTLLPVALIALTSGYSRALQVVILLSYLLGVLASVASGVSDVLRGREDFSGQNRAAVADRLLNTVLVLLCIRLHAPLWMIVASAGISSAVNLLIALAALGRLRRLPSTLETSGTSDAARAAGTSTGTAPAHLWRQRAALSVQLAAAGMPFFAGAVCMTVYGNSYNLILDRMCGPSVLGWYSLVTRLFGTAMFIPTIVTSALLPALVRMRAEAEHEEPTEVPSRTGLPPAFIRAVQRMIRLMVLCAAPVASILIWAPANLIRFLHYPATFLHAVPVFVLFGTGLILWFLSVAVGTTLTVLDRQRDLGRASAAAALLVVPVCVGCVFLADRYLQNGAIGAAVSHLLLEIMLLTWYLRVLPREVLPTRWLASLLLKTGAAALPMGLLAFFLRGSWGIAALVPGAALYALLCLQMRCITRDDILLLTGSVLRRRPSADAASVV